MASGFRAAMEVRRGSVSLPSIDKTREGWYLGLFSAQCLACLAVLAWYEVGGNTEDSALATVVAIGKGMGQLVIVVAAWTVTLLEGYSMLAERYLMRRYREGEAKGEVRGEARGRAKERAEWRAWLERSREAQARGEPFDEPPPGERRNGAGGDE